MARRNTNLHRENKEVSIMIKNPYNLSNYPKRNKLYSMKSQTVPDQTMSIKTILERHTRGLDIPEGKASIYEEEDMPSNGINPKTLDLVDLENIARGNKAELERLQETIKESKRAKNSEKTMKVEDSTNSLD